MDVCLLVRMSRVRLVGGMRVYQSPCPSLPDIVNPYNEFSLVQYPFKHC